VPKIEVGGRSAQAGAYNEKKSLKFIKRESRKKGSGKRSEVKVGALSR